MIFGSRPGEADDADSSSPRKPGAQSPAAASVEDLRNVRRDGIELPSSIESGVGTSHGRALCVEDDEPCPPFYTSTQSDRCAT